MPANTVNEKMEPHAVDKIADSYLFVRHGIELTTRATHETFDTRSAIKRCREVGGIGAVKCRWADCSGRLQLATNLLISMIDRRHNTTILSHFKRRHIRPVGVLILGRERAFLPRELKHQRIDHLLQISQHTRSALTRCITGSAQ